MPREAHLALLDSKSKVVKVAAGIILRTSSAAASLGKIEFDQVLIAKRPADKEQGGLWEFPGGKLDCMETPLQALQRELLEEIDIKITDAEFFKQIDFQYPNKVVKLHFFKIKEFIGIPKPLENQEIRWIKLTELEKFSFPAANQPIVQLLLTQLYK